MVREMDVWRMTGYVDETTVQFFRVTRGDLEAYARLFGEPIERTDNFLTLRVDRCGTRMATIIMHSQASGE